MRGDQIATWLEGLKHGWESRDPAAISDLFSESAGYKHNPYLPAVHGRQQIRDYWRGELEKVTSVDVDWGAIIQDGQRVAVEYRATTRLGSNRTLDFGVLLLEFDNGLCTGLREYWMLREEAP